MSDNSTHYELWYSTEGVSITEYTDTPGIDDPEVGEEWWFTWPEVFAQLTNIEERCPSVHSEP